MLFSQIAALLSASLVASEQVVLSGPQQELAKSYPGSPKYPTPEQWQTLNATTDGKLIAYKNPLGACYWRTLDIKKCLGLTTFGWFSSYVSKDPGLVLWPQYAGPPCPSRFWGALPSWGYGRCGENATLPDYIVAATSAKDVARTLTFAAKHNVRLVVKNTGHDFLGRNTGKAALSIWTRNIRGPIEFIPHWSGKTSSYDVSGKWQGAAVKYGSGYTWIDLLKYVVKNHDHVVVSGGEPSVGAGGGWLMGGGHGPLSSKYGFGVENVLEFEVVLPSGRIVIANEESYPDLFWALRGGGGGTFGIVTSVTYKAYPRPSLISLWQLVKPKSSKEEHIKAYYDSIAFMYTQWPNMTDFGVTGYSTVVGRTMWNTFMAIDISEEQLATFWNAIEDKMKEFDVSFKSGMTTANTLPNYVKKLGKMVLQRMTPKFVMPTGYTLAMGSRILANDKLVAENAPELAQIIRKVGEHVESPSYTMGVIQSPGPRLANRPWNFAFNPAWATSSFHLTYLRMPNFKEELGLRKRKQKRSEHPRQWLKDFFRSIDEVFVPALEKYESKSAAYMNEVSVYGENWKESFWGDEKNYAKLLEIKQKYDPSNLLWCHPCVGSDVFFLGEDDLLYNS